MGIFDFFKSDNELKSMKEILENNNSIFDVFIGIYTSNSNLRSYKPLPLYSQYASSTLRKYRVNEKLTYRPFK